MEFETKWQKIRGAIILGLIIAALIWCGKILNEDAERHNPRCEQCHKVMVDIDRGFKCPGCGAFHR